MKVTAVAPANIAFIKYWGKKNEELRLPANSSISLNLDKCFTITTVEFAKKYKNDSFEIIGEKVSNKEKERVFKHLERIRNLTNLSAGGLKAKVVSKNSFPKSAGIAASASGFAALTLAGVKAVGLDLSEKELTILARLGSGSACRSIPDGFVEWKTGDKSEDSYAYSLYPANYWDLRDIICIVETEKKKVSSTEGMEKAWSSPFYRIRLESLRNKIEKIKKAMAEKNFKLLGEITEEEAINMHCVMMTQKPALFYWTKETIEIIQAVLLWRNQGTPVYFTIDAGPNVHLICQGRDEKKVVKKVKLIKGVKGTIINKPADGTRVIKEDLF